jgi:hypothetical protein
MECFSNIEVQMFAFDNNAPLEKIPIFWIRRNLKKGNSK